MHLSHEWEVTGSVPCACSFLNLTRFWYSSSQWAPYKYNTRCWYFCCIHDRRKLSLLVCSSVIVFPPCLSMFLSWSKEWRRDVSDFKAFKRFVWDSSHWFWELLLPQNQGTSFVCKHRNSNQRSYQSSVNCYKCMDF